MAAVAAAVAEVLAGAAIGCVMASGPARAQVSAVRPAVVPTTGPAAATAASAPAPSPAASASAPDAAALRLQASTALQPAPGGDASRQRPTILRADSVRLRPDLDAVAEGAVEFRRAGTAIQADRLSYDSAEDLAQAQGRVRITTGDAVYRGQSLRLKVQRFEGWFLSPEFEFIALGAGGSASRIDFLDSARAAALDARYSSCPREGGSEPDWLLKADRVRVDLEANEGIAEGAVLQFLGVPILGLPVLSFPLSDARKSGWLPPTIVPVNNRNGLTIGVPYYWNIAPNRDATLTPVFYSKLGLALDSEFRYLMPHDSGRLSLTLLPHDRVAGRARQAARVEHEGHRPDGTRYSAQWLQVSDNDYWKDFAGSLPTLTPRLLNQSLSLERPLALGWADGLAYARMQRWQVLQTDVTADRIDSPYQRAPQVGLQLQPRLGDGWQLALESEANRFNRPDDSASITRPTGWRWHGLAQLSRPVGDTGLWLVPRLKLAAVGYQLDQPGATGRHAARLVPTLSLDAGLALERQSTWFGRPQRQMLEPRLLYVRTPFRDQAGLPLFDTADRDFNTVSIFADNAFSGQDRVSDANLLTAGARTRWVDAETGAETLRLGMAQRFRFSPQRVTLDGSVQDQRLSDVLLDGSTSVWRPWRLDASLQYNPDGQRIVRSVLGARYSPGPYRTVSMGYRQARGLSEQLEFGWQWPVWRGQAQPVGASGGCGGTLYAVGRVNYSLQDRRTTDSLAGAEYDAGCWIGRLVVKRTSISRNEASTQLLLQVEFVGLSRLGTSPLQALKDNVPGYQLLREPGSTGLPSSEP